LVESKTGETVELSLGGEGKDAPGQPRAFGGHTYLRRGGGKGEKNKTHPKRRGGKETAKRGKCARAGKREGQKNKMGERRWKERLVEPST